MRNRRWILLGLVVIAAASAIAGLSAFTRAARRHAESMSCANAMTSICFAGRMWATDHDAKLPSTLSALSNELATPKILACQPALRVETWQELTPEHCTYEIDSPGLPVGATNTVFLRCRIHGHLGYSDSTVFDGVSRRRKFE